MKKYSIGDVFERLTIMERLGPIMNGSNVYWLCKCSCGSDKEVIVNSNDLGRGHTKSCGCVRKEVVRKRSLKHGHNLLGGPTQFYRCWYNMKQRCDNPNNERYQDYGGCDITYDPRWNSFVSFKEDMYMKYLYAKKQLKQNIPSIERENVFGNYNFDNCIFIEKSEQSKNQKRHRWFRAISPSGKKFIADNKTDFSIEHNLDNRGISACLEKRSNQHRGWKFHYILIKQV